MLDIDEAGVGITGYVAPESLSDVIQLLSDRGEDAKVLAGGQSLLVMLRQGYVMPELLVSLSRIEELRSTSILENGGRRIGAMVRQAELEQSDDLRPQYTALTEAVSMIATVQVRNQGTLGGNLCHADPTADPPAALIALGATLEVVGLNGSRNVAVEEFFRDFMEVDLAGGEVLAHILLPPPVPRSGSAYLKHRVRQVDTAIVGAAAWLRLDETGSRIRDVRIGLSGVGMTPIRPRGAEEVLCDASAPFDVLAEAGRVAATECDPVDDTEASAWYRNRMVEALVERVVATSLERAGAQRPAS